MGGMSTLWMDMYTSAWAWNERWHVPVFLLARLNRSASTLPATVTRARLILHLASSLQFSTPSRCHFPLFSSRSHAPRYVRRSMSLPLSADTDLRPGQNLAHLLPPSWRAEVQRWFAEDTPSFDWAGFVVGEEEQEAVLWGKSGVSGTVHSLLHSEFIRESQLGCNRNVATNGYNAGNQSSRVQSSSVESSPVQSGVEQPVSVTSVCADAEPRACSLAFHSSTRYSPTQAARGYKSAFFPSYRSCRLSRSSWYAASKERRKGHLHSEGRA